jgi:hypothetical protein
LEYNANLVVRIITFAEQKWRVNSVRLSVRSCVIELKEDLLVSSVSPVSKDILIHFCDAEGAIDFFQNILTQKNPQKPEKHIHRLNFWAMYLAVLTRIASTTRYTTVIQKMSASSKCGSCGAKVDTRGRALPQADRYRIWGLRAASALVVVALAMAGLLLTRMSSGAGRALPSLAVDAGVFRTRPHGQEILLIRRGGSPFEVSPYC